MRSLVLAMLVSLTAVVPWQASCGWSQTPAAAGNLSAAQPEIGAQATQPTTWSQFRGMHGDGKFAAQQVPVRWSRDKNIRWRFALPGPGNSSPIVAGDQVFITCASSDGRQRTLYCLDRVGGEQLWSRTVEFDKVMPTHKTNLYCASTPLVVAERVVVWHGSAGLYCYDLQGTQLWTRDLGEFRHIWGYAASPVYWQGQLILNCGPGENSFMTAIDLRTGETRWKTEEAGGDSGDAAAGESRGKYVGSWSTPVIAQVAGRAQIICNMPTRVNAYDPLTGEIIWFCRGLENQPRGDLAYASPMLSGDMGVAAAGFTGPAIGFKLGGQGDVTDSNRLWRDTGPNPQRIGSGVIVDQHLYLANAGAGVLQCLEIATGNELWRARLPANAWGSIVMADGRLYVTVQNGETVVFAADPAEYREIAVNPLDEESNSTPAVSDGQIFIRTFAGLYCIQE